MAAVEQPLKPSDHDKLFEKVDKPLPDSHGHNTDAEDDHYHDDYLDSEVREADTATPYPQGTPQRSHPSKVLEREDTTFSLHSGSPRKPIDTNSEIAAAVEMSKAALHGSPLKKTSSGPYLNRKVTEAQMATDSFPNSPKKQRTESKLLEGKGSTGGTPTHPAPLKPEYPRGKDPLALYRRTASSEEEELNEIYEQQRLAKEMAKKKAVEKAEKKAAEKKADKKGKEKEKEEERKKKKKKKHQGPQTVTRDSYLGDSRRDTKSKTKVCILM
ncbi:hypothetical protein QR680_014327 [Steinernema hermaphroditum]|uniref:Uncharacterized protein n=1 Tax=Steinernema hermaphroditum TaxID=289476 RepID=A0AA39IA44_9BILA|nr:hypothetical protein QR680_014327 [Steinernema hermaphroditum]